jgi:hypothetical protein
MTITKVNLICKQLTNFLSKLKSVLVFLFNKYLFITAFLTLYFTNAADFNFF